MNLLLPKKLRAGLSLFATAGLVAASSARAQEATAEQPITLDKFEVTGSYIPAAADERLALPVQMVNTTDIKQTGVTRSVLDVLRKSVPQIVGGLNIGVENGNVSGNSTNGGSQIALRNTSTLVLIDGQRVAFDPVAGVDGYQFVDLNVVPVSAVERIEVLTDGASALYGSDAVSGVVNIILKKNYEGAEVGTYYGFSRSDLNHTMYRDRSVHMVAGAAAGKTNITVSAEWSKSDPLFEKDYSYTAPSFGTTRYGGVVWDADGNYYMLNPSLKEAPAGAASLAQLVASGAYVSASIDDVLMGFDLSKFPTFQNSLDKQIASIAFDHAISDSLNFKGTYLYSKTSTWYCLNPQPLSIVVNNPKDPTSYNLPGIPFTDEKVTVANRFLGGGAREYPVDTNSSRATAALEGKIGTDWTWHMGALYNTSHQITKSTNQILNSALLEGIQSGLINFTAPIQDAEKFARSGVLGDAMADLESKIIGYDARATGRLFEIPMGSIYTAAGVGYRKEILTATADKNSTYNPEIGDSAWNNGLSINPFDANRTIKSAFIELKVPLASPQNSIPGLYTVTVDGAVRHEVYSDTDDPTVPKISLRWLPLDEQFAFRSTFSKSFSAPTLYSLFGPMGSGATSPLNGVDAYDEAGNKIGTFPNVQGQQQSGSNPNLKPSKSKNYTVGGIFSPKALKGLSIAVDYYHIKETDIVGSLASTIDMVQDVEQYGPASKYAEYIHLGNFGRLGGTKVTAPGQLHKNPANVYVDQFYANVATQIQDGVDIDLKYSFDTSIGHFDLSSTWVYLRSFRIQPSEGEPFDEYAGNNGQGTLPKYREYTTVAWHRGAYGLTLTNSFIPRVTSYGDESRLSSFTSFDIQAQVDLGQITSKLNGLDITIGVNNVFDKYGPRDDSMFSDPPIDTGLYGAIGRFYYVSATYKF